MGCRGWGCAKMGREDVSNILLFWWAGISVSSRIMFGVKPRGKELCNP